MKATILTWALIANVVSVTCNPSCKVIPGDVDWPTEEGWEELNNTVAGNLVKTHLPAQVCHDPMYDAAACTAVRETWDLGRTHLQTAGGIMNAVFQNESCTPFTARSTPCELGNYVSYSINVSNVNDVIAGLRFATKRNVRLVVRNTGHDFLGKSTGHGALALWTHNLKALQIIAHYGGDYYDGPALKLGAGVLGAEALQLAHRNGFRVVTGTCPTVGLAGGYTQGGGHSILSGLYGLSADNVLEWEVVTANGSHLVATPRQHSDLFWALSGGGGGTYGVVISMTVRLHPDGPLNSGVLSFDASSAGFEKFWNGVALFHSSLPTFVDKGVAVMYGIGNGGFQTLAMPWFDLEPDIDEVLQGLKSLNISYAWKTTKFPSWFEYYTTSFGPLPYGRWENNGLYSSRLVSRSVMSSNPDQVHDVMRKAVETNHFGIGCLGLNADRNTTERVDNAVLPAWRNALAHCMVVGDWDRTVPFAEVRAREFELANVLEPAFVNATPNSGTYLNEANYRQLKWQQEFYGENYQRLLAIKRAYDPEGLFYAITGVGSDGWHINEDHRLCRARVSGRDEL